MKSAKLIVLRENYLCKTSINTTPKKPQGEVIAVDSCSAIIVARQDGASIEIKNGSFDEKIPAHSILSPNIELQHPPNHAISRVSGKVKVQVSINQSIISLFQFRFRVHFR